MDIVKRLRSIKRTEYCGTCTEAADKIERLRAALQEIGWRTDASAKTDQSIIHKIVQRALANEQKAPSLQEIEDELNAAEREFRSPRR